MTPEQGLIDLETTYKKELAMGWAFIRKLALFVGEWGPGYIYQVADHLGRAPKTLQNYVSLARSPLSHYAEELGLSRQHAGAVVGLPEEEGRALLLTAAEEGHGDDWLRFEARARKLPPAGSSTGSLTGKEQTAMDERTYRTQVRSTLTTLDDGGTVHRANGEDPYHGVTVADYSYTEEFDEDVPFALPPDPVEGAANDTPFDVAERVVRAWGVPFARQVAEEVMRWGEWRS